MALVLMILALLGATLVVKSIGNFLKEEFECKTAIEVIVKSGDTITDIASEQVQNGNCRGYEPLYRHLVKKHGVNLQPGDRINIPLHS